MVLEVFVLTFQLAIYLSKGPRIIDSLTLILRVEYVIYIGKYEIYTYFLKVVIKETHVYPPPRL